MIAVWPDELRGLCRVVGLHGSLDRLRFEEIGEGLLA
jgi:hypothetical protein